MHAFLLRIHWYRNLLSQCCERREMRVHPMASVHPIAPAEDALRFARDGQGGHGGGGDGLRPFRAVGFDVPAPHLHRHTLSAGVRAVPPLRLAERLRIPHRGSGSVPWQSVRYAHKNPEKEDVFTAQNDWTSHSSLLGLHSSYSAPFAPQVSYACPWAHRTLMARAGARGQRCEERFHGSARGTDDVVLSNFPKRRLH